MVCGAFRGQGFRTEKQPPLVASSKEVPLKKAPINIGGIAALETRRRTERVAPEGFGLRHFGATPLYCTRTRSFVPFGSNGLQMISQDGQYPL
jgi:hypothetical protein